MHEPEALYARSCALSGRSFEETAKRTGLSVATVRKYVSRARKRLKKLLKMEGEGGDAQ